MHTKNKFLVHIFFWLLSFVIFSFAFNISGRVSRIDLIYSLLFHVCLFYGAYLNLLLLSVFFAKKKYFLFTLGIALTLGTAIFVNQLAFDYLADLLFPGYYLISNFELWESGILIAIYMLITSLLKLSYAWFELQRARQRIALIEKENIKSELSSLKAQMNPHFLFNSLNTIYALALKGSDKTPDAVVQLADILRYVTYQSGNDAVALIDESRIIADYIALQKRRSDSSARIDFSSRIDDEGLMIAPLLLLPLVENGFKHGVQKDGCNAFVNIELRATNSCLVFRIVNSKPPAGESGEGQCGIGNENIRQRLNLLYPEKHSFAVEETSDSYSVFMQLEL